MDCMHNRDAELAIIGTAINDAICAASLAAVQQDFFADKDTAALHRAVMRLAKRGTVDMIALANEASCDLPDPYGLIAECASKGFAPSMYGQYEAILSQCHKRRTLAKLAQMLAADANNPAADPDALAAQVISTLQTSDGGPASVSLSDALMAFIDDLGAVRKSRCLTGLPDVDRITGGFRGGHYVAIGARPGVGKSAFALATAVNIARRRGPVLFASLEMSPVEIAARCVAAESGVDSARIAEGDLDEAAHMALAACYPDLSRIPLRITDKTRTPLQLRREAVRMKSHDGLAAIVVDYIGLMRQDGKAGSRYEAVTEISVDIKALAMELDVPIIVLTQFNRSSEAGRDGKAVRRAPQMSEAKDSGSIEQDANSFLVLYNPPPPEVAKPGDPAWESWCACDRNGWEQLAVIIEKNRAGRKGVAFVGFDKARMRFHNIDLRRSGE